MYSFITTKYPGKKRIALKDLLAQCLNVEPINKDWSENFDYDGEAEDGGQWTYIAAVRCENCGHVNIGTIHENDECQECNQSISGGGPMMNYWYPLTDVDTDRVDTDWGAQRLVDLPLVLVKVDGVLGLALTGGGMHLSWEICEAFMALGFLPPLHFADLPQMVGRGTSPRDRWIIAACQESALTAAKRAATLRKRLRQKFPAAKKRQTAVPEALPATT